MYLNPMELPPGGPAATLACAILAAQADRLDRLNVDVTDELGRYARSRARIGDLITKLVDELDELDAADLDIEDDDPAGGDVQDQPHDENHFSSPDLELTSCETRGAGFNLNGGAEHDDAEDGHDREWDQAEMGVADQDALSLEFGEGGYR